MVKRSNKQQQQKPAQQVLDLESDVVVDLQDIVQGDVVCEIQDGVVVDIQDEVAPVTTIHDIIQNLALEQEKEAQETEESAPEPQAEQESASVMTFNSRAFWQKFYPGGKR